MRAESFKSLTLTRSVQAALCALAAGATLSGAAWAETAAKPAVVEGAVFHPLSNGVRGAAAARKMRTFLEVVKPKLAGTRLGYVGAPPVAGWGVETPGSLECIYRFVANKGGCTPDNQTITGSGGSGVVAIVDAYDYSAYASTDLATFSTQFGLPAPTSANFEIVYASGTQPASSAGTGWDIEESLDIEMAHAMAPAAKVILVEAASSSFTDLFTAVQVAANLVQAAGGGQVSMSWGGGEWGGETAADANFLGYSNVVFYASSGDSEGTYYPCVSPNVVCVGGTAHVRNPSTIYYEGQITWSAAGAGLSAYEATPSYQSGIAAATSRAVPDVAAIADPNNAVWVWNCSYFAPTCLWFNVGGTSVASPVTAALDNHAGKFAASNSTYLTSLYSGGNARLDVTYGRCGKWYSLEAGKGWDLCTGWGSPNKD